MCTLRWKKARMASLLRPNSWKDRATIILFWEILTGAVVTGVMEAGFVSSFLQSWGWAVGFQVDLLSRQFGYAKTSTAWVLKHGCGPACVLFIYVVFSVIPNAESSTWPAVNIFVEYQLFLKVKLLETSSSSECTLLCQNPVLHSISDMNGGCSYTPGATIINMSLCMSDCQPTLEMKECLKSRTSWSHYTPARRNPVLGKIP